MKYRAFCLFVYFFSFSNTQNIIIIDNSTKKPIKNVNIYNDNIGTTSNKDGFCNLKIFNLKDLISFSAIGYQIIQLKKEQINNEICLKPIPISMNFVHVIGDKKKDRAKFRRLEKDVRRVYPYAKLVGRLIETYKPELENINKKSFYQRYMVKQKIFKKIEIELIKNYGFKIRRLNKRQGRILIRLIDRETENTSYSILKEFRNVFNASFWQLTARIFGHNLKSSYNPKFGEDMLIESIINRMELL